MPFLALLVLSLVFSPSSVYAVDCTANANACPAQISSLLTVMEKVISFLAPVAAIAFFIMLVIGAYKFITSGGDPKGVGAARSTITYAVIGVVLVVAAWLILQLIGSLTGADVTTVTLPTPSP